MLRKMGIFLAALAFGVAAIAEEMRAIEYEAMYEQFVARAEQGKYVKATPGFTVRDTELDLSTLTVIIETPQGERIDVEIEPALGASNFPIDKTLIGSKVLTNAPSGTLGFILVYQLELELTETWSRDDVVGSIEEFQEIRDQLGFFARLVAPDLAGFIVIFDNDEAPSATFAGETIEGKDSQLLLPIESVREGDFSEITFSSVPSEIYFYLN